MTATRTPILYLAPWVDLGGADRGTIDWFKQIDRSRWAPSLITTQPSPNRWLHHVEPYAEEVWNLPDLMPGSAFPEFILGFIESRGVRLVQIMNSRLAFDLLPDMTCLPKPPAVVVQMHAEEPGQTGYVRYVTRRYGNLIDAFSLASEGLRQTLVAYEVPPSKCAVIHLGVEAQATFDPASVDPIPLNDVGTKRVLWPGRLAWEKDPMLTLDVLARSRGLGGEFVLDIVGEGPLQADMRSRAEELGVAQMIRWHPPSQEMPRWYRSADLVLMTSLFEGIPLVIYEALAMGVPVVAPALPGNAELMDADSGVLVDPREDPDGYAEAIVELLADEGRRREMGRLSRQRMLKRFSLEEMGRRHGQLYESLLAGRSAAGRWRNEELFKEESPGEQAPGAPPSSPIRMPRDELPERTVGVIVPCYGHGLFLEGCIASIKAQTLEPDRIVVVDDGSEDPETSSALERLDRDPDVTVLRQPENRGPSAARNRGLAELETSYVLPIDADDELLPDALERMLERLEAAPPEIGFVYPHAQHIGNRSDRFEAPAYNLWLLMGQNYCAAPALFDRRLFSEGGVAYPEEIVVGHEDWDLVLELAERGVRGVPADAPTFRYRKQGFSRVNAVDYGPDAFHRTIEGRHPHLYGNRDAIKARWAPAVTLVLLDEEDGSWDAEDLSAASAQSCRDFELVARSELREGVRVPADDAGSPIARLQQAIDSARGRWIVLLPHSAAALLEKETFVEELIHAFAASRSTASIVLGGAPELDRPAFSQLSNAERQGLCPAAVAFERPVWTRSSPLSLGGEESLLADVVVGLQIAAPAQWRLAPTRGAGKPWSDPAAPDDSAARRLDLNLPEELDPPQAMVREMVARQPPRLPELTPGTVRRWSRTEQWAPPASQLICRHLNPKTGFRMVTAGREPPPGCRLEQVLGSTRLEPAPGAKRLVHASHSFELTTEEGGLPEGHFPLGYVEQQPLPMLVPLELRRVPGKGQEMLVAGPGDELVYDSEPLAVLGWIEPYPLLPRAEDVLQIGPWRLDALRRRIDRADWRTRYEVGPFGEEDDGVVLGYLHRHPASGLVALRLREDGRLVSDLVVPGRATRDPRKIARWLAEPAAFGGDLAARAKGTAQRLRNLALRSPSRRLSHEGTVLGYLLQENAANTSTLFSMIHSVTGDQLATRSPEEGALRGYVPDGVLGAIIDPVGEETPKAEPEPAPWARLPRPA